LKINSIGDEIVNKEYEKLIKEIEEVEEENNLKDYHAFIYWFIETFFGYAKEEKLNSICDGTHNKGVDAVLIDSKKLINI